MRRIIGLGVVLVMLAACSSGSSSHTLKGSVTLTSPDGIFLAPGGCTGTGGYDDIGSGAQVTVTNEKGATIGTSQIVGDGKAITGTGCEFRFTVKAVPDSKFYGIEVSHRGKVTYSRANLDGQKWSVGLTLG